eukprot:scaffold5329_cov112-Isochrysis_galbana.AAC.4
MAASLAGVHVAATASGRGGGGSPPRPAAIAPSTSDATRTRPPANIGGGGLAGGAIPEGGTRPPAVSGLGGARPMACRSRRWPAAAVAAAGRLCSTEPHKPPASSTEACRLPNGGQGKAGPAGSPSGERYSAPPPIG